MHAERSDLEDEAHLFLSRFAGSAAASRPAMKQEGADLASRLVHGAMDLGYSKATEFSPRIQRYQLLAAKVGLLVHWPDEQAFARYERGVFYYRSQESARGLVDEYTTFRSSWVDAGVVRI